MFRSLFLRYAPNWLCPIKREEPHVIIHKIVHVWTVEEVEDFLKHKMRRMRFAIDSRNQDYYTALGTLVDKKTYSARDKEIIHLLLEFGANPLQRLRFTNGLMYNLAVRRETDLLLEMLNYVKDINSSIYFSDVYYTALHLSVMFGLPTVMQYIIDRKPDVNRQTTNFGMSPLHLAARIRYHPDYTNILLNQGASTELKDERGRTALLIAVQYNILELVSLLLLFRADPRATDFDGQTALHYIFLYHGQVNIRLLELLCSRRCCPNEYTHTYQTPIQFLAVRDSTSNKIAAAQILIRYGANLSTTDIMGDTVLHIAAKYSFDDIQFMKFLLKEGTSSGIRNIENETFIDILKERNLSNACEIIRFLVWGEEIGYFQFDDRLLESIYGDARLFSLLNECRRQMGILTSKTFSPDIDYVEILTADTKCLKRFSTHSGVDDLMEEFDAKDFPFYEPEMQRKLKKLMRLHKAHNACYNFISDASREKLSYNAIMDILKCLPVDEVKKLARIDYQVRKSYEDLLDGI